MNEVNENLPSLLRGVASRMENGAGELRKDLLEKVADRIEILEEVASIAAELVSHAPVEGGTRNLLPSSVVGELVAVLRETGRTVNLRRKRR